MDLINQISATRLMIVNKLTQLVNNNQEIQKNILDKTKNCS